MGQVNVTGGTSESPFGSGMIVGLVVALLVVVLVVLVLVGRPNTQNAPSGTAAPIPSLPLPSRLP